MRKKAEILYQRTGGLRGRRRKRRRRWRGRQPRIHRQTVSLITALSATASYKFTAARKKLAEKETGNDRAQEETENRKILEQKFSVWEEGLHILWVLQTDSGRERI